MIEIPTALRETARQFISDELFNTLLRKEAIDRLKSFEQGKSEAIDPTLLIVALEGDGIKIVHRSLSFPGYNNFQTRSGYIEMLGRQVAKEGVHVGAVFLLTEAWMRAFKEGEERGDREIADYDDKREGLIVFGSTFDFRTGMAQFPITRNEENGIVLGFPTIEIYRDNGMKIQTSILERFYYGYMKGLEQRISERELGFFDKKPRRSEQGSAVLKMPKSKSLLKKQRSRNTGGKGFNERTK